MCWFFKKCSKVADLLMFSPYRDGLPTGLAATYEQCRDPKLLIGNAFWYDGKLFQVMTWTVSDETASNDGILTCQEVRK